MTRIDACEERKKGWGVGSGMKEERKKAGGKYQGAY
jgi:hypothetical protein